jgi:hypothetical protein
MKLAMLLVVSNLFMVLNSNALTYKIEGNKKVLAQLENDYVDTPADLCFSESAYKAKIVINRSDLLRSERYIRYSEVVDNGQAVYIEVVDTKCIDDDFMNTESDCLISEDDSYVYRCD